MPWPSLVLGNSTASRAPANASAWTTSQRDPPATCRRTNAATGCAAGETPAGELVHSVAAPQERRQM
eukprot:8065113-Lingulodinium_polyedra.AAC.1